MAHRPTSVRAARTRRMGEYTHAALVAGSNPWCAESDFGPLQDGWYAHRRFVPASRSRSASPPSFRGLGHRPFKATTRVRIPLGVPIPSQACSGLRFAQPPPLDQFGGIASTMLQPFPVWGSRCNMVARRTRMEHGADVHVSVARSGCLQFVSDWWRSRKTARTVPRRRRSSRAAASGGVTSGPLASRRSSAMCSRSSSRSTTASAW